MKSLIHTLKHAFVLTAVLMLLCSVVYPLCLTAAGKLLFPKQAEGSLVRIDGRPVGSLLVGQDFTDPGFFRGRVSSVNYNTYEEQDAESFGGVASGSFNYGPSNPELVKRVEADMEAFLAANPGVKKEEIPADLLTASGSGLDPHISVPAANIQIPAVSKASGLSEEALKEIVERSTEHKWLGVLGEEKVNVLKANLEIAKAVGR